MNSIANADLLSKRNDPWSSYKTGEDVHQHAVTQREQVLDCLRLHGPMTGAELGVKMGGDKYAGHRRLPELERDGLAERAGFKNAMSLAGNVKSGER